MEVHGAAHEVGGEGESLCPRVERAGDTVFCYAKDVKLIIESLAGQSELLYMHRAASLRMSF